MVNNKNDFLKYKLTDHSERTFKRTLETALVYPPNSEILFANTNKGSGIECQLLFQRKEQKNVR